MTYLLQAAFACALAVLMILWMRRPAERFGLMDHPGGRKRHDIATPLTGGLAITLSFFFSLSFSLPAMDHYVVLFVAIAMLAIIGAYDDRGELFPRTKLGVQVFAAVIMTSWGGNFLHTLGDLFGNGPVNLLNWSIPLTVFAAVCVINAINTFDGVDGLAGSLVIVMLGYFAFFSWQMGDATALKLLVVLIGALAGFLLFNAPWPWRRANTFMGDAGSQVLGMAVAWFSVDLTQGRVGAPPPVAMLWVVGIVLLDLFTVTIRRIIRRRSPATPDRGHIHHLLLRRGLTARQTVFVLGVANIVFGAVGTVGWLLRWPEHWMFAGFVVTGVIYFAVFLYPARFMRLGRRMHHAQEPPLIEAEPELGVAAPEAGVIGIARPSLLDARPSRPALRRSLHAVARRLRQAAAQPRRPGA